MTPEIVACLAILALAVGAFAWDRLPADVIALGVMLAVIATGLLPADKAFAGFSSDTVMMILGLLIMTAGLVQTGVVEIAGRYVFEFAGTQPRRSSCRVIMVSVRRLSAFMSNTAATAFFVPLVIGYAAKIGVSPSSFLLPLAFASILTSSVTLISTSTNLIVSDLLTRYQQPPMGMFELAPVGIPIAIAGLLYVWLIGVRLMPERDDQKPKKRSASAHIRPTSSSSRTARLSASRSKDAQLTEDAGLSVVKVIRGSNDACAARRSSMTLELAARRRAADRRPARRSSQDQGHQGPRLQGRRASGRSRRGRGGRDHDRRRRAAAALAADRPSLRSLDFKERYGLQVLAIHRAGRVPSSISSARLRMGDVLLLQGTPREREGAGAAATSSTSSAACRRSGSIAARAPLAAAIFVARHRRPRPSSSRRCPSPCWAAPS